MGYAGQARVGDGAPGAADIELTEDAIQVVPEHGDPVHVPLVDLEDVHDDDYVLRLEDHTGTRYELTMLGKAYGQLLADLRARRHEVLERDLLLRGVNLQDTFPGKLLGSPTPVPVEVRVYEDLLVVIPERGTMFGVPFSFVERVDWDEELYQVRVVTDDGRTLVFGHLAKRSEEFRGELRRLLDDLARRTSATLAGLLPGIEPASLSRLATLLRDGRAAQQRDIDAVDPTVWPRLEEAASATDQLRASYERLRAMTPPGWAAFGVKAVLTEKEDRPAAAAWEGPDLQAGSATDRQSRSERREQGVSRRVGAASSVTGAGAPSGEATVEEEAPEPGEASTDLWYFCPLASEDRPVNAVAQEVASGSGHATYLFRLMEPDRFASLSGEALAEEVGRSIARLNRALLQLNFRREPIYLPEEQIQQGPFGRYRVALRKLDHLRWARKAFLGRAVHNSSWPAQVEAAVGRS
ncbi:MAG: hypothetical protein ACRDH8_04240 [Actinomycetota bacterium]